VTDAALVEHLRQGDAKAVEALMERFGTRVYRLAYGITRNASDAEEVVQDVFLTVVRKIDAFEARSALGTWIHRVTTNTALNKRRGKRSEVETSLEELLPAYKEDGHRDGERSFVLADWSALPDEALLSREGRREIARALDALPAAHRAVLVLRNVEGLSSEEAADALGESVSAVKSRLHRARMALREQLTRAHMVRGKEGYATGAASGQDGAPVRVRTVRPR
jgi:RNA polymerase sigma-70 factor (ECF subfamily)